MRRIFDLTTLRIMLSHQRVLSTPKRAPFMDQVTMVLVNYGISDSIEGIFCPKTKDCDDIIDGLVEQDGDTNASYSEMKEI